MPKVSVIMPCFNHARFLAESVSGVLRQTHADLELIVIDDCSSDDSWATINALASLDSRIRAIRHSSNKGASQSRNTGLRAVSGLYIAFCDADDIWEEYKLTSQLRLLQDNPDYDVVYCDALVVNEDGAPSGKTFSELFPPPRRDDGLLFEELVRRNFINMQCVLMRRDCTKRVEGFDRSIKWVEDWWYWVQLSRYCRFLYSPRPMARYRVHNSSTNQVHRRGYSINRFRVLRRIVREFPDLHSATRADVVFNMGVNLCEAGKYSLGRRLLWASAASVIADLRALKSCCRAIRRLMMYAGRHDVLTTVAH